MASPDYLTDRIADLKRKAKARKSNPQMRENLAALAAEIARLEVLANA